MWKILGKNDEVTTCECCGKSGLKLTVVLTNGGAEVRYGRDCAARAIAPICRNGKVVGSRFTAEKIERMADDAARGVKPKAPKPYFYANGMR